MHPSRIFALYLVLFEIATAVYTALSVSVTGASYLVIFLLALVLILWSKRGARLVLLAIFFVILPLVRIAPEKNLVSDQIKTNAVIINEPQVVGKSQKFMAEGGGARYQIYTNQFPLYDYGDEISINGKIKSGGEDSNFRLHSLSGVLSYPEIISSERGERTLWINFRRWLIRQRGELDSMIGKIFNEPEGGLIAGLLLGTRAELSPTFLNELSRTGVVHIIALSGFNITIMAAFVQSLFRNFSGRMALALPVIVIWGFVFSTALSASVVRAAIMGTVLVLASVVGRRSDGIVSVLFASALMVFANPYILLSDIGFQLSLAATVAILFLAPRLESMFSFLGPVFGPIMAATLAAQLFTWPLTSYYFGSVSLIAPLVNFLILPVVETIMLLGMITVVVGFISIWLATQLSFFAWVLSAYIIKTVHHFSEYGFAAIDYKNGSPVFLLGYYLLLAELTMLFRRGVRLAKITT